MAEKVGAYGNKASEGTFRRKWDKEEWTEKARQKDQEEKDRMKDNEDRLRKGQKPRRVKEEVPKPTELMQQRDGPLELDKNLGKTLIVNNPGGRGPGQPGFYCEICNRTSKDSAAYLDHINGRSHLRKLGQTTTVARSSIEQVRARIAFLREKTKEAANAKAFDFEARLNEVKAKEDAIRQEQKEKRKAAKEARRIEAAGEAPQDNDMMAMMGFGGFGSSKK